MKHAAVVVIAAGIAGASWFRTEQPIQSSSGKIQIPDPGPSEDAEGDLLTQLAPDWQPTEQDVVVPLEPLLVDQIAEKPSRIQTISDEQPFAVSDESAADEAAVKPAKPSLGSSVESALNAQKPDTEWKSVEGRPISVRRLGTGRYRTVIVTGLDGRDRAAVAWADDLADALEQRADLLEQQEFVLLRAANPDGLAAKVQKNGHGVVLNRNFPTKRYHLDAAGTAGAGPASEPETRAVLQTLYEVRPQRVIHLSSTTGNSGAYFNLPGRDVAERLTRQFGLHSELLDFDRVPGSLEEFADATWSVRVVRLNLRGVPEEDVPRKVLPVLLSAVSAREQASAGAIVPASTPRREPSRWQNGPTSSPVPVGSNSSSNRHNRAVNRRGYEELPPPPQ